jgi:hypothetical protein
MTRGIASALILTLFVHCTVFAGEISLENAEKLQINYTKKVEKLEGSLFIDNAQEAQTILNKQQEADFQDIESLWNATVSANPTIRFSLKKLAIPEEQRRIHSSLMAKSLGALISGASMMPSFMGMNYATQTASFATARLAHNFINKDNSKKMNQNPLTDTEVIALASAIEDLQDEIVHTYYSYKGTLNRLKDCRAQLLLYNRNYSEALKSKDELEIMVSSALWDEGRMEEYILTQEAKKYRLMLQRLAGKDAVDGLNLIMYDLTMAGVEKTDLNLKRREVKVGE